MKITFIFPRENPYDSRSVRDLPSGGTEKCVIFLGEAFQKLGHEVEWITTQQQLINAEGAEPDVVITQEAELLQLFPNSKRVWWTHHFADQPIIQRGAAYGRCFANKIVTLSQCHSSDLKTLLRLDSVTIGHGVWLEELAQGEKDPYRLIYASTPFRGLERIPALFRKIKESEPRATIAIASSMSTYGDTESDKQYQPIFDELAQIPGVELLGSLNQAQLYAEYAKASIFFYPCIWPETYCLAMDEAIAHGCWPVVPPLGALPERAKYSSELLYETTRLIMDVRAGKQFPEPINPEWVKIAKGQQPKGWLEVAKQWEREVLNG